jgi:hypothetical protein
MLHFHKTNEFIGIFFGGGGYLRIIPNYVNRKITSYIYLLIFTKSLRLHVKHVIALTKRESVRRIVFNLLRPWHFPLSSRIWTPFILRSLYLIKFQNLDPIYTQESLFV